MYAIKRIDSNHLTTTQTKAGKVVATSRTVVSKDGKVTTITAKGTAANGKAFSYVEVYAKQ
jgi:hypothetical protein